MADGGWNCEWVEGSTRSSFHSTLNSLKGLLYYEAATGGCDELRAARRSGEQYLLQRRLLRTLSTGELVGPWVTRFAYPCRWIYSVLNAAEYFRAAALRDCIAPDPRLADAIEVIRAARRPRRHLAAGTPPPRASLVRDRRASRRAVQVAHLLRHTRPRVVGRRDPWPNCTLMA